MQRYVRITVAGTPRVVDLLRNGSNATTILSRFYTAAENRTVAPALVLWLGSSTTAGQGATTTAQRYVNLVTADLQAAYPRTSGSEASVLTLASSAPTAGVASFNGGQGGTDSYNFMTATRLSQIAALPFCLVNIMIGTNDSFGRVPATYKANIRYWLDQLQGVLPSTTVYVLHRGWPRGDIPAGTYTWDEYGTALAELAAEDPDNVVYRDQAPAFAGAGWPGADPLNLIGDDDLHATDAGHAFLADLVFAALSADTTRPAPGAVQTPLTLTGTPTLTGATTTGSVLTLFPGTWDQTGVTFTYQWRRDGARITGQTAATYTLTSSDLGTRIDGQAIATKTGHAPGSAWASTTIPAA